MATPEGKMIFGQAGLVVIDNPVALTPETEGPKAPAESPTAMPVRGSISITRRRPVEYGGTGADALMFRGLAGQTFPFK